MVKTRLYYCQCIEAEVKAAKSVLWASALTFDYFRPGQSHRCSCPTKLVFQLVSVVLQGTIQKMSVQPRTLLRSRGEVVLLEEVGVQILSKLSQFSKATTSQWNHTARVLTEAKLQVPKFFRKKQIDIQNRKRTYPFLWKYQLFRKSSILFKSLVVPFKFIEVSKSLLKSLDVFLKAFIKAFEPYLSLLKSPLESLIMNSRIFGV